MKILLAKGLALALAMGSAHAFAEDDAGERLLNRVSDWMAPGYYDNMSQVTRDLEAGIDDDLVHRPMYQMFVPVDVPKLNGRIFFQQAYLDSDLSAVIRVGLMQFTPEPGGQAVRLREYQFASEEAFHNAYQTPEKLAQITTDDLTWDEGCDFVLTYDDSVPEFRGPIGENSCFLPFDMFEMELVAEDEVVIRPGEFWFLGRYVDAEGNIMWGTESDELNKLVYTDRDPIYE